MDSLLQDHESFTERADLSPIIQEVDDAIHLLEDAQQTIRTCKAFDINDVSALKNYYSIRYSDRSSCQASESCEAIL